MKSLENWKTTKRKKIKIVKNHTFSSKVKVVVNLRNNHVSRYCKLFISLLSQQISGPWRLGLNMSTSLIIRSHQCLSTPQPVELQCKHSGQQKLNVNHNCSCQRWANNHLLQTWTSYNVSHAHLGAICSRAWRSQWPRIDSSLGLGASAY